MLQLLDLALNVEELPLQVAAQVHIRVVEQYGDILQREPLFPVKMNFVQPGDILLRVEAVPRRGPGRGLQQSDFLIKPDSLDGQPGHIRRRLDGQHPRILSHARSP